MTAVATIQPKWLLDTRLPSKVIPLTPGTTVVVDCWFSDVFSLATVASQNSTLTAKNSVAGVKYRLLINGDSGGSDVLTLGTGFVTGNGTLTLAASTQYVLEFMSDGTNLIETGRASSGGGGSGFTPNVATAGRLIFSDAVTQVVPGATSWAVRNNANSADNFKILDNGVSTMSVVGGDAYNTDAHTVSLTLSGLTTTYANTLTAFNSAFNTDTGTVNYTGIIRGGMSHVNVFITGGTISTLEAHASVVSIDTSSTGGSIAGGYANTGEWLFQDGATTNATGTIYAAKGSIQLLGASTTQTAYGGHFELNDTVAKAGTFNAPIGARGYVEHNAATTWGGAATGLTGEVFQVGAGTITGITAGAQGWVHNTGDATYTGAVYGLWGLVAITGAAVTSNVVYGAWADLTFAGTAVGGTTNAALNAEVQNSGTSSTITGLIGVNVRWRVNNAALTQTLAIGINVMAPNLTASSTTTTGYGIRINDQSTATGTVTTSYGLRIENQAAANANAYALFVAGGRVQMSSTNGSALFTSASQAMTISTTTSGTLAITSAGLLTLTGVGASVWTPGAATIVSDASTGIKIGTAITQLLGFYNATPIAQRAGAAQTAVITTASTLTTPFGYTTQAQADAIVTLVNELRAWAVAQGFIKGSA